MGNRLSSAPSARLVATLGTTSLTSYKWLHDFCFLVSYFSLCFTTFLFLYGLYHRICEPLLASSLFGALVAQPFLRSVLVVVLFIKFTHFTNQSIPTVQYDLQQLCRQLAGHSLSSFHHNSISDIWPQCCSCCGSRSGPSTGRVLGEKRMCSWRDMGADFV